MVDQIKQLAPSLSRAERKVADAILADPPAVVGLSIAKLASAAGVSQPTVLRFCRALGLHGYRDFKVRLAQALVARPSFVHAGIAPGDPPTVYSRKVVDSTLDMLLNVRGAIDHDAVDRAVDALGRTPGDGSVLFCGFAASGAVAMDAAYKFFFLVAPCFAYTDSHMQYMAAGTLRSKDVLVAVSHTGRTRELIRTAKLARERGATVIAITTPGSPLADASSIVLAADVPEDTDVYTPSVSRIVHLLLIDVLAVGVALRQGQRTEMRVRTMKRIVQDRRVAGGEAL